MRALLIASIALAVACRPPRTTATGPDSGEKPGSPDAGAPDGSLTRPDAAEDGQRVPTAPDASAWGMFHTSFEPKNRQPICTETLSEVENVQQGRCAVMAQKPHIAHTGSQTLTVAGMASGAGRTVFRLFGDFMPVREETRLNYWLRAQNPGGAQIAIDLLFSDGTTLMQLAAARDFRDCPLSPLGSPIGHCGVVGPDAWVEIEVPIGRWFAGKDVWEVRVVFQGGAGPFNAQIDDLSIGFGSRSPRCLVDQKPLDVGLAAGFRVIPLFLAASDAVAADTERRRDAFERAMRGIQRWYSAAMGPDHGGTTFQFDAVRVLGSKFSRAQWDEYGAIGFLLPDGTRNDMGTGSCGMWYAARGDLIANGLLRAANLPAVGSRGIIYVVVGGGGVNGSCGGGGLAASEAKLLDDIHTACPNGRVDACSVECRATGAIAHELGHAFGLPHGMERMGGCSGRSLMDLWWEYDTSGGATLCAEDRRDLAASGFFAAPKL